MTYYYNDSYFKLCIFLLISFTNAEMIKSTRNNLNRVTPKKDKAAFRSMDLKPRSIKPQQIRVVRGNQSYYRPDLAKYPRGAVYPRYRLPPFYMTFRCPPKAGLLSCRASCEKRNRNTFGSCDSGYCTCLPLTPGFRGLGVFSRRANCALRGDRSRCNRFCSGQFGSSVYGIRRVSECRCFVNPNISPPSQGTACAQARRRLAHVEARVREALSKRP